MDSSAYAYSPSSANVVEFPRHTASEDRAPYDAGRRYEPGFVILPVEVRSLPPQTEIVRGTRKRTVARGAMLAVYAELAAYAISSNTVWPSVKTLADALGYSEDYTADALAGLEQHKAIIATPDAHKGMKRANRYTLPFQKSPNVQMPPTAATLPPQADTDTATGGNSTRPQRHERDKSERDKSEVERRPHPISLEWQPAQSTVDGLVALGVHASRVDDLVATYREWYAGKGDKRSDWNPGLLSWARRDLAKADCPLRQAKTQRPATLSASGKEWRW